MSVLMVVSGSAKDIPLQGRVFGADAVYGATDVLEAEVRAHRLNGAVFVPAIAWFTDGGTQTGYDQGQVLVSYTTTQAALLQPTVPHTLLAWRTLAGDASKRELIVRMRLLIEAPPIP